MKKLTALLCSFLLAFSLAACGSSSSGTDAGEDTQTNDTDYSNQTVTGRVTKIDGTDVTVEIFTMPQGQGDGQQSPEASTGEDGDKGQQPPEAGGGEDGDKVQQPPEAGGGQGGGQQPPEASTGEDGDKVQQPSEAGGGQGGGQQPPEASTGEDGDKGQQPSNGGGGQGGGSSVTFSLADASITVEGEDGAESTEGTIDDITTDSMLELEVGEDNKVTSATVKSADNMDPGQGGGSGDQSGEAEQGSAATTIQEDSEVTDETYTSKNEDENALRVDQAEVTLKNVTVKKSSGESSNVENGDFYGMNAALLATNGANLTIENATVTSSAQNGNGVFSYGEGTVVNISDSTIKTSKDNSGGIQTTGGGTTNATGLTVETAGNSSAAIRSDRGGGTVNVEKGSYTSKGYNSPAVYSTAAITVKDADLTAENSEALVIEGKNSISLEDCDVSGNMSEDQGASSDENVHNVMIYQSMSGDADVGTSSFSMKGGTLTGNSGDMFFITNTDAEIDLSGVSIENEDADGNLMTITGNSGDRGWGTAGANGANVTMTADGQTLTGKIVVDDVSTLNLTLTNGSSFEGSVRITDNEEGGTAVSDNAVIQIEEGCTWTLTEDCTVTSVTNEGTIRYNGHTITLADGTVMK